MNASEDQSEPLGEAPDVTMSHAVPLVDRQAQALREVRELHTVSTIWNNCGECQGVWPCTTVAILERLGL